MAELILAELLFPAIVFAAGWLANKFISGTKNEKVFAAILHLIEVLLDRFEVDVPEFLQELLKGMHDLELETEKYESIVLDDMNKLQPEDK